MKKIAIEEHFMTEQFQNYIRTRKEYPKTEIVEVGGKKFARSYLWSSTNYSETELSLSIPRGSAMPESGLGEGRVKSMDESGIDMEVLSLGAPGVGQFGNDGTSVAKSTNDELAEAIKRYPKRFAGFAAIAPQDPDAAAAELERAVTKLGLVGTMITGHVRGEFLDDKKFWVIFEMAEKLDVPIYIHPIQPPPDMLAPYLTYPELALPMWGMAAETGLHAMRLICSGLFDKYPNLKIILGHMGEAIPYWLWRLDSRWLLQTPEYRKKLKKKPSQYFKDNFYVTTSGMYYYPALLCAYLGIGADRILFATDGEPGGAQFIESLPMSDGDKEKIAHLNAETILKL